MILCFWLRSECVFGYVHTGFSAMMQSNIQDYGGPNVIVENNTNRSVVEILLF